MWNSIYQHLYDRRRAIIKKDATTAFHKEKEHLYLERDASGMGLRATYLQMRGRMWFSINEACDNAALWPVVITSKSLTSSCTQHSNTEREALGMTHGPEKISHYCFTPDINVITDHELLVTILNKKNPVGTKLSPLKTSFLEAVHM